MDLFTIALITLITYWVCHLMWVNGYWTRRSVFQFEPEPFFGNARKILFKKISLAEVMLKNYKIMKEANLKHAGMYIFTQPHYIPIDPVVIKGILQNDFSYFVNRGRYYTSKDVLSMHLLNIQDDAWRNLRAKLTPTFTSANMKILFATLVEKTIGLVRLAGEYSASHEACDVKDMLARFTTDVIGSCAFGIQCDSLRNPRDLFREYTKKATAPKKYRMLLTKLLPWWLLGILNYKENGEDVAIFFTEVVEDTIKFRERYDVVRKDFMHLLVQLKNNTSPEQTLTVNEIIAQCFVFFVAGFETSATTMSYAMYELANHQDIQIKLMEEIETVINNHEGKLTYEAVMDMEYLDQVVHETLRMYPPDPVLPRICNKNYQVPGHNLTIEKGVMVMIPVWGLHRDEEYYPNPDVFNPDNFTPENKSRRPDCTYLPFGEGPRNCIGMRFGLLQTKVGLISLLRNYRFVISEKTKVPFEMECDNTSLTVKGGIWLNLEKL